MILYLHGFQKGGRYPFKKGDATLLFIIARLFWAALRAGLQITPHLPSQFLNKTLGAAGLCTRTEI